MLDPRQLAEDHLLRLLGRLLQHLLEDYLKLHLLEL